MTQRTKDIISEVDTLEDEEFQEVFYSLIEKNIKRKVVETQILTVPNGLYFVLPYYKPDLNLLHTQNTENQAIFLLKQLQNDCKDINFEYSDDDFYQQDN